MIFRQGDNPLTWAVPLGRYGGIEVRLSLFFIVYVTLELARAGSQGALQQSALALGSLFLLVLLHEFGHCIACRRVGGEADEILLWPLGGLAMCRPPHHWKADLITTIGGPMVNVLLVPVLGGAILLTGGTMDALLFNPFNPATAWASYVTSFWTGWLWWAYFVNWMLLAFNVLTPAYPMDGGRMLQGILWRSLGYRRATTIACQVGLFAAGVMLILGMVSNQSTLVAVAILCGITCFQTLQMLRYSAPGPAMSGFGGGRDDADDSPYASSLRLVRDDEEEDQRTLAARKQQADQQARDKAEEDRILDKIAKQGMASLSRREQEFLKQATEKRRAGGPG